MCWCLAVVLVGRPGNPGNEKGIGFIVFCGIHNEYGNGKISAIGEPDETNIVVSCFLSVCIAVGTSGLCPTGVPGGRRPFNLSAPVLVASMSFSRKFW